MNSKQYNSALPSAKSASELLDRYFPATRSAILEIAATCDRLKRADNQESLKNDPKMIQIAEAMKILASGDSELILKLQMLFSDESFDTQENI